MSNKILFKITSRTRPERFFQALDSIVDNLSNKENYFILCTFDVDDKTMCNKEVRDRLARYEKLVAFYGISHSKINAVNRDLALAPEFDILVNVSDDQKFLVPGFDDIIRNDMPEDLDWFLHYPDSHTKDKIPTMSIMGANYFKRTNQIYHPDFISVYADNYAMTEAKYLGRYLFVNKTIQQHFHPMWNTAENDEQYIKNESRELYNKDRETYFRLIKENFNL